MSHNKKKYVILVGDGMGDEPIAELDGRTPLEAARTPAMDFLAGQGTQGLLQTVPEGFSPGSDVANLSLLGYLPQKYYTGRAPLEAASLGVQLAADEIAYRCNLVTLDRSTGDSVRMVDYSSGHIATNEARTLVDSLAEQLNDHRFHFYPGVSYRHLLVFKGEAKRLITVPPHDFTGQDVSVHWAAYQASPLADVINSACDILAGHQVNRERIGRNERPANAIWLWGEGRPPTMPTLRDRFGIEGSLISAVDLLKGIGVYAGLEIINVPGATGYLDTNYRGKAEAALKSLADRDFVFVHVEAPDEASHHGLIKEKIQAIEDFDQKIVQPVLDGLKERGRPFRLVVAMDHFTPIRIKTHSSQPVPVAIYDSEMNNGSSLGYSEANARRSKVFFENGEEFIRTILQQE